ncbi:hypothetical protein [Sphingomonas lenta]|uniref:Uncharacterized protein n=1 Tax=Sphingomonas lenta TaxID=1141887 RepID=A0A2A2SFW9_9SPHN|nr:hypothetical protein [Sphingomonas lenta]PAX07911.1 hypothetical protein CKY28_09885 [Sphingomonas lenta]
MTNFLRGLFGGGRKGTAGPLAAALDHYPPNTPPHPGPVAKLTEAEAEANLRWFLGSRDDRLAALGAVLTDHGMDVAPVLDPAADPVPTYRMLTAWLREALPPRDLLPDGSKNNAPVDAFIRSERRGDEIFFSFVADLALLEGEGVVRRSPGWRWDLARAPADAGTYGFRRVALVRDGGAGRLPLAIDLELETLELLYAMRRSTPDAGQPLGRTLGGVVAGTFDAF